MARKKKSSIQRREKEKREIACWRCRFTVKSCNFYILKNKLEREMDLKINIKKIIFKKKFGSETRIFVISDLNFSNFSYLIKYN